VYGVLAMELVMHEHVCICEYIRMTPHSTQAFEYTKAVNPLYSSFRNQLWQSARESSLIEDAEREFTEYKP
jgi:hypothetical protein